MQMPLPRSNLHCIRLLHQEPQVGVLERQDWKPERPARDDRGLTAGDGGQNAKKGVNLGHTWEVLSAGNENEEFKPSGAHAWNQRNH